MPAGAILRGALLLNALTILGCASCAPLPPLDAATSADTCPDGLPRRAFAEASTAGWGRIVGDFSASTLDSELHFRELWSGCDSYVFIPFVDVERGYELWNSDPSGLFRSGARNVHFIFASFEDAPGAAEARVRSMRDRLEAQYALWPEEKVEYWRPRIHYLTEPIRSVTGSISALFSAEPRPRLVFGIDREQRFDFGGSVMRRTGGAHTGDFSMISWLPAYYDYMAELEQRLAGETGVTDIPLVDERDFSEGTYQRVVELPDAATMETFDTLEFDLSVACWQPPGDCSRIDSLASISLCKDEACARSDRLELARWIAPYSRPGRRRWTIDASPMLGLLAHGGTTRFHIHHGSSRPRPLRRDVSFAIRLSNRGRAEAARITEPVYRDFPRAYDARYNEAHPPFSFTPPRDATRVELAVILSGHGQTEADNCAEWCGHEHEFSVDGAAPHRIAFPDARAYDGCAELVRDGVVPGQYGNWPILRAGWCPGYPVKVRRFDLSDEVVLGQPNTLRYRSTFEGGEPRGGSMYLTAYLSYYR